MSTGEFARVVKCDRLPTEPLHIEANDEERTALARRFGLPSIEALSAEARFSSDGEAVEARGRISANYQQHCAVTNEPFAVHVEEPLAIRFVRGIAEGSEDEAIEFARDAVDEIEFDGTSFDLGEAVAQSFGLALDPYATGPGADALRREAGLLDESTPKGPFAALANFKPNG